MMNTYRIAAIVFAFLLAQFSVAHAADPVVVIMDDGAYLLDTETQKMLPVRVCDMRENPDDPLPDPDPDPDPDNPPSQRAAQIAAFSEGVGTQESMVAVAGVLQTLYEQGADQKAAFDIAFNVTLSSVSGGATAEWQAWKRSVDQLADGYEPELFRDAAWGLAKANGIDLDALNAVPEMVRVFGKYGAIKHTSTVDDLMEDVPPSKITIEGIIQIILTIIELLRTIGILPGGAT